MLTIFGKKKKEEKSGEANENKSSLENVPSTSQGSSEGPSQSPSSAVSGIPAASTTPPARNPASTPPVRQAPSNSQHASEETSLNKLLQSLLQDLPNVPGGGSVEGSDASSTPDYVPLRSTPPSRPMVIEPGDDAKGSREDEEESVFEKRPASPPAKTVRPPEPSPPAAKGENRAPPAPQKRDESTEKPVEKGKLEKPEKPGKESGPRKDARSPQGFEHIFQLTQGNLETPGLVIINGPAASGKTTLCAGLTNKYLKLGNPCLYVTYDQAPSNLRGQLKKLGSDPTQYESQYRLIIVDGYSSQNESFSMEPYYIEQPFDFESVQDALVRNSQIFMGEKIRVVFDSINNLASKVPQKELVKKLGEVVSKLKDTGVTVIVTVNLSKLSKDLAGSLEDLADCIIDLSEDDSDANGRQLKVRRVNRSSSKTEPETFEIDSAKGLVFV